MKYDELVEYLGELGPYQKRLYFLVGLPMITGAIHVLLPVFTIAMPEHRCVISGLHNDTYKTQGATHQALINYTLPWKQDANDDDDNENSKWGHAQCHLYRGRSANNFVNSSDAINDWGNQTTSCDQWVYDTEVFDNTFTTQADLICEDKMLRSHINMIFMCGLLVGSFLFGHISDRFGRKTALMIGLFFHVIANTSLAFAQSFAVFATCRFFSGVCSVGIFMSSFVLAVEQLGPKYRAQGGVAMQFFWVTGMVTLNVLAYFIRDWRHLQLAVSCYGVLYLLLYWVVPESPRWQISQGQLDKAKVTMEKVAKANGMELPKDAFTVVTESSDETPKGSMKDLFTSPVLLARAVVVFINWMVGTMVYYGMTLNVGSLGGSIYVNFAFATAVELLSNIATLFALPTIGRKRFHCVAMLLGGVACLACMVPVILDINDAWVIVLLSNVGKLGATAGFTTIHIYTAELFPTYMRNSVVGTSSMVARIGGLAAPYIAELGVLVGGHFGTALPYVVFGACSVLAGLLALTLPETLNAGIPETIEDAIHFGKTKPDAKTSDGEVFRPKHSINSDVRQGPECN